MKVGFELLGELVNIDSTTGSEAAYLGYLEALFVGLGWQVERQEVAEQRWNLWVRRTPSPRITFCTHVDTVPPHIPATLRGTTLHGRGACDTKGVLLAMVEAVLGLPEEAQQECGFVWVVGEEVDHIGASVAGAAPLWTSEWMVMGEPTQNRLATGQRGILKIAIETTGQAGHSAFEEAGHSALEPLLDILTALRAAGWPSDPLLGVTRFNIGVLHAGVAANVYPPNATAELLFRAVSDPAELLAEVERRVAGRAVVRLLASNPPVKLAYWADLPTDVVPFNTDAPYMSHLCPVTLVGPGDIRTAHSEHEQLRREDYEAGVLLYRALVMRWLAGDRPRLG